MKKLNLRKAYTLCVLLVLVFCVGCGERSLSEKIGKDVRSITDDFNKGYKSPEQKREYIGMTATIIYLQETNQLDSVTIDLHRLLQIQDSVSVGN